MKKVVAIIITVLLLISVSVVQAEIMPALDLERNSSFYSLPGPNVRTSGWEFSVSEDLAVVGVGIFDLEQDPYTPGLMVPHDIGVWHLGELIYSTTIPAGTEGKLIDQFRYIEIDPLWLTEGETYVIGAVLNGDPLVGTSSFTRITTIPSVIYERTLISSSNSGFVLPTIEQENYLLGPNFLVIPEPMAILLLGAGGLLVRMRANRKSR